MHPPLAKDLQTLSLREETPLFQSEALTPAPRCGIIPEWQGLRGFLHALGDQYKALFVQPLLP